MTITHLVLFLHIYTMKKMLLSISYKWKIYSFLYLLILYQIAKNISPFNVFDILSLLIYVSTTHNVYLTVARAEIADYLRN